MKEILFATLYLFLLTGSLKAQNSQEADSTMLPANALAEQTTDKVTSKMEGDSAYINADYSTAIEVYEGLLQDGEAAELYYNLGNSYYKTGDIGRAILNYERALLLNPANEDYRANLEIAKAKTVDKINAIPDIFFVAWIKSLIHTQSVDSWAKWGIAFFILFLVGAYFFIFSTQGTAKKIGFFGALVALLFVVCTNVFASYQKKSLTVRNAAIVISPSVTVRSTPSQSGTTLFVLHEGVKVNIKDNTMSAWKEISLEDGKVGWIEAADIELI